MMNDAFQQSVGHIWVNAASEGPLLKVAHHALEEAVKWKSFPHLLRDQFFQVPVVLKQSLAKLMGVEAIDVILGTSASYGLFVLANSFSWNQGDEVLVMENDFPTNILPWLPLEKRGVCVKQLQHKGPVLTAEEVERAITPLTKWICLSHIHSFSGYRLAIPSIAEIAKRKGIHVVVNISQSLGSEPLNVSSWDVDAVVGVGYKWLCGPYGTGFVWIKPQVRQLLDYAHPYWPVYLSGDQLQQEGPLTWRAISSAKAFDMFGTANFFNFVPLKASVDFWLDKGMEAVKAWNDQLIVHFLKEINRDKFTVLSPQDLDSLTHLLVLSAKDSGKNQVIYNLLMDKGIYPAYWKHRLRFSPHIYNTFDQISKIVNILNNAV